MQTALEHYPASHVVILAKHLNTSHSRISSWIYKI